MWKNERDKPEYAVHPNILTKWHSKVISSSSFSTKYTKSLWNSSFTNCLWCEEFNKTSRGTRYLWKTPKIAAYKWQAYCLWHWLGIWGPALLSNLYSSQLQL